MWQRFTDHAKRVIFFAQEEAGKMGDNNVSIEHILLGLTRDRGCGAALVLTSLGVDLKELRTDLEANMARGSGKLGGDMQLTPRAKRAIDYAYEEGNEMHADRLCSEHLLLGVIRQPEGLAARTLAKFGVELEAARQAVKEHLSGKIFEGVDFTSEKKPEAAVELRGKSLLDIAQLSRAEIDLIFKMTKKLKEHIIPPSRQRRILEGKTLAMIFEKPSLRTRVSFETGIFQLGGHGIYLSPNDIGLGKRESIGDVAQTIGRMCDIIMARVFEHEKVTGLAKYAGIPVINALSDLEHPCQALADFYTILEHKGKFEGLKLAFIGDGNNVAHSLMLLAAKVGMNFAIGCPKGYEPDTKVTAQAKEFAKETGAKIEVTNDAVKAVSEADIVYTDVWASMGQEAEAAERAKIFAPFQVNADLMKHAKPDAIFEHCLPAHRNSEVTDEVIDSPQSVVFDEAENRLHAQKAVMVLLAG